MNRSWTMKQALFCLIGSTLFTLTLSLTGYTLWRKFCQKRLSYQITAIIQTGPEKEALKTAYLAQLLDICVDFPTLLYAFDVKEGEKKLLASPLISHAKIKRLPPSTLYIDYEVRKPIAWVGDFQNTAIDQEGFLFPIDPFFSPKRLPEIYFGVFDAPQRRLQGPHFELALQILQFLKTLWDEGLHVQRIDVSNAFVPSLGQREVVLITEEEIPTQNGFCIFPKMLRLCPNNFQEQLCNFHCLRKSMMEDYKKQLAAHKTGARFAPRIIDLRIPQLAFVEKG